jgi:hypothetical protein
MLMVPGAGAAPLEGTLAGGNEAHPANMATNKGRGASRTMSLRAANYAAANSLVALTGSLKALHNALRLLSRGRTRSASQK